MTSKTKAKAAGRRTQHPLLSEKEGALKREDVMCPICWSILMQPVTMPCRHSLCLECFKKHVAETSLQCPCCRMRLSVWSRKATKDNQLVDSKLWIRIQKEFPRLVETRLCGQDSQALEPLDLISMADREEPSDMINKNEVNEEDTEEELLPIENRIMDGVVSTSKGDIKRELEAIVKQHQEDIENTRRREEIASSELIKQLQDAGEVSQPVDPSIIEADLEAAKKLSQELEEDFRTKRLAEINASRRQFVMPKQPKSASANRIEGWINSSQSAVKPLSGNSSCLNNLQTPKKRPSTSSLSSQSEKKPRNNINRTEASQSLGSATRVRNKSSSKDKGEREVPNRLENSILTYLSPGSSNSAGSFAQTPIRLSGSDSGHQVSKEAGFIDVPQRHQTIVSKYLANKNDSNFGSAFSPNSSRPMIPRQIIYSSPLKQERFESVTTNYLHTLPTNDDERDIPTPNSIDFELNTHFRPIKSAPKTPPKRLPDGSYLPDPPIIKSLPARILLPPDSQEVTLDEEIEDKPEIKSPSKIASLEGKRNSNDSGRGSSSPEQRTCKSSPNPPMPNLVHYLSVPTNVKATLSHKAPIISPEGLRSASYTSTLPRALDLNSTAPKISNSVIIKQEPLDFVSNATPTPSTSKTAFVTIKQEIKDDYEFVDNYEFKIENYKDSKEALHGSVKEPLNNYQGLDLDEVSLSLVLEESVLEVMGGTPVNKISKLQVENEQEKEYRRIQERAKQMETDRQLAEKLQKMLDKGKNIIPPRSYSLRSWITRKTL